MSLETIKVFVGADATQKISLAVLAHSIKRHTKHPVEVTAIDNALVKLPDDVRYLPYTNFSYSRFAIPKLCDYQGKAIYLDSDMLVFEDIEE